MPKLLKGQLWYFDLIIALTIFILVIILSFKYLADYSRDVSITSEAETLSESLLSEGLPKEWDEDNVSIIGIMDDNELDLAKLSSLQNMSYERAKTILSIRSDFSILILNRTIGMNYTDPENLVEFNRYVVYRHDDIAEIIPVTIVVFDDKSK
jgi:hypothetical protein